MYLLDTNIVNYLLRKNRRVTQRLVESPGPIFVSTITIEEIIIQGFGPEIISIRSGKSKADIGLTSQNMIEVIRGLSDLPLTPYTPESEAEYKKLKSLLRQGLHKADGRIAAHALILGYILVTENRKDFERIPGLKLVNWAEGLQRKYERRTPNRFRDLRSTARPQYANFPRTACLLSWRQQDALP